jgi:small subunit ribosomal protein S8
MSMNYLLADALTRIRNAQNARLATVKSPVNKLLKGVLDVLKKEGYIADWKLAGEEQKAEAEITLKYFEGEAVIKKLECVSKPGRRHYANISKLPKVNNGLGIFILSTSSGIMSDHEARQKNVGGEVLCSVF